MPEIPRRRDVEAIVSGWLGDPATARCITRHVEVPGREARTEPFPDWVSPALREALERTGITELYRHQRLAVDAARRGEDVVVVTPTASGKSLCYHLPVLQAILEQPEARAFYLFPTKALSQDQVGSLQRTVDQLGVPVRTWTYDGDTPADARTAIRQRGHVIVSNPDMLHAGILPNHPRWRKVLQDLRFVVVDEAHTYRGVFGSHVANVLRRLRRLCDFYGSSPVFICSSATLANPAEHAARLIGREPEEITLVGPEENGAPAGPRELVLWNPPVVNAELGIRRGVLASAQQVAAPFVEQGIPAICFCGSRLHTELLAMYLRERFCKRPGSEGRVASYRGGYLPGLRRQIERGLRDGEITCVVSTNALELGIDIGRLDVCVMAGWPGSVASLWQQAGRAGRSERRSLAVLVARNTPMDQYVVEHPDWLLGNSPEHARIDPDNLMVLVAHVKCALYEMPFRVGDAFGGEDLSEVLGFLAESGVAHRRWDSFHWASESYPADAVSLRSADPENVVIIDSSAGDRVIAETDRVGSQTTVHEGAITMVDGQPYQVDRLDWEQQKAFVRRVEVDHYTTAMSYSRVRVIETFDVQQREQGGLRGHGEVHVARRAVGYKKVKMHTSENVGYGDIHLPDVEMHTTSFWLSLDGPLLREAGYRGMDVVDGLLGLGRVMQGLAALHLMCEPSDLGLSLSDPEDAWVAGVDRGGRRTIQPMEEGFVLGAEGRASPAAPAPAGPGAPAPEPRLERPTIFLYDQVPGGVGFAERIFGLCDPLLLGTRERIAACDCEAGCPSCVGPLGEVDEGARAVALDLCDWLLGRIARPRGPEAARALLRPANGGSGSAA
jgi:DEAD/DEAH box helicase domain-containing protein